MVFTAGFGVSVFILGFALFRSLAIAVNALRRKKVQDLIDEFQALLVDAEARGLLVDDLSQRVRGLNRRAGKSRV